MIALVLPLAAGTLTFQFAQTPCTHFEPSDRVSLVGLIRTIDTLEVTDFQQYGSYASWQTLRERHETALHSWLTKFHSRQAGLHFAEGPEILPGWNLRLCVQADGQGYVIVLEDAHDQAGYAAQSDKRGIIQECKYLP